MDNFGGVDTRQALVSNCVKIPWWVDWLSEALMVFLQMVFDVLAPRRQCLRENKNDVLPLQRSRDLQNGPRRQKSMTQELKMLLGVTSISLLTLPTISQHEQHQKLDFKIKIPPSQCWYFLKIPPSQSWYFSWTKDRKMGAGGGQCDRFFTSDQK